MTGIANLEWAGYFVTLIRGPRVAFLAGPFPHRLAALDAKPEAYRIACEVDPAACFDRVGTSISARTDPGVLNDRLSAEVAATLGPLAPYPHPVRMRTRQPRPETP